MEGNLKSMDRPILLDTGVLVDFFRGCEKAVDFVNAHSKEGVLSAIVVAELYSRARGIEKWKRLTNSIELSPLLPVTGEMPEREVCTAKSFSLKGWG